MVATSSAGQQDVEEAAPHLSRRLVLVIAIACGLSAANLYYAQPLLDAIARDFHSRSAAVGLVVTLTQLGYGAGLLFVLPLGDLVERRMLVSVILVATMLALCGAALAPSLGLLYVAALAIGVTSVVAQVLVAWSAALADAQTRGSVVGTVMTGLLLGILLARTLAGFVGQLGGWRAMYGVAAALMLVLNLLLRRELPTETRSSELSYGQLLRSVLQLLRQERVLRQRAAYGALGFASFSVFWTSAAFLLSQPPFGYSQAVIGLFGLVGAAGALCARPAGLLADRGLSRYSTTAFMLLTLLSFLVLAAGKTHVLLVLLGVIVLDLGVQGLQITNQSEIYRLGGEARSRITTAYMTAYFLGGALGSATAAAMYDRAGWYGVCTLGALYAAVALVLWLGSSLRHSSRVS